MSDGYSKKNESRSEKIISGHPLGYLHNPSLAQIEEVSIEEYRDFIEYRSSLYQDLEKEAATAFMLKLSPHSQRVFLSYLYEKVQRAQGSRNYHFGNSNDSIAEIRQGMIDYLRKQAAAK